MNKERVVRNIIQQWGPLEYNNEMMGVMSEYESPGLFFEHLIVTFWVPTRRELKTE